MSTLLERFDPTTRRYLADGAWGTELMKRGGAGGDVPERLNLTSRATVLAVAKEYVDAGADIILTNSFGGSRVLLDRHRLGNEVVEINRLAAEISKEAAGDAALVAGSIGPTGKLIITGDIDLATLRRTFLEQASALVEGGVDLIVVESMSDVEEMQVAVASAREAASKARRVVPIISSMVYEPVLTGGYRTIMGNTPRECAERALESGASLIGANCGTGIERYIGLSRELVSLALAPVWIKPNRGIPELVAGATRYRQDAAEFAGHAKSLLDAGVAIVGGCCGTTPEFVAAMRPEVDAANSGASHTK